jgi:flagellar M-ring protein FliF
MNKSLPDARTPLALIEQIPALRPILLLAGVALAVAVGMALFMWSRGPDWTPLMTGLADRDAAVVVERLRSAGVRHRIGPAMGTVSVPRESLHQARLQLAADGLPGEGGGFELLRETPGFGVSQFMESARYQHVLETELARTIASLAPVRGARVHLAVSRPSAFTRDSRPAAASVVVDLYPGRSLDRAQAQAIVNLVASSVPDMTRDRITVVDQAGRLLTSDGEDAASSVGQRQFELARQTETLLARRIETLLEPMLGVGRVRAQVSVEYDNAVSEQASERFNPDPNAVRQERIRETMDDSTRVAEGAAGAAANMPDAERANGETTTAADRTRSRDHSRDFELGREIAYTRDAGGRIRRLSAAVLVDRVTEAGADSQRAPTEAELNRIRLLVEGAIGFDPDRGDRVTVDHAAFLSAGQPAPVDGLSTWQQVVDGGWMHAALRNGGGALALLVLILAVIRPTLKALVQPVTVSTVEDDMPRAGLLGPSMQEAPIMPASRAPYEAQLEIARGAVQEDPKRVAQLMKSWVGNDG